MTNRNSEWGFTVVEMITAVVVMSLFAGFLFQTYLVGISQKQGVIMRAAANDLAMTNLRKITSKSSPLVSSIACGPTNDMTATPAGGGTNINFASYQENPVPSPLPSSTTQTMRVLFPRGCNISYPIKVLSIVRYGTETVSRATYVQ